MNEQPYCPTCEDGKACNCAIATRIWAREHPGEERSPMMCACMGFGYCPDCGLTARVVAERAGITVITIG